MEWSLAGAHDVLAAAVPERNMLVLGCVRRSYAEVRPSPGELREFAAKSIARFKAPRAIAFCDAIGRHPTGKPDYQWARRAAESATPVAGAE